MGSFGARRPSCMGLKSFAAKIWVLRTWLLTRHLTDGECGTAAVMCVGELHIKEQLCVCRVDEKELRSQFGAISRRRRLSLVGDSGGGPTLPAAISPLLMGAAPLVT